MPSTEIPSMPVPASEMRQDGLFLCQAITTLGGVKMFTDVVVFAAVFAASLNILATGYICVRALVYHWFQL